MKDFKILSKRASVFIAYKGSRLSVVSIFIALKFVFNDAGVCLMLINEG
jgi:hypothetical protein